MASSEARPEDSESVRLMATALDSALDRLPPHVERTDEMRREAALFIVERFRLGEHDLDRLSELALAELSPGSEESREVTLAPSGDDVTASETDLSRPQLPGISHRVA